MIFRILILRIIVIKIRRVIKKEVFRKLLII